MTGKTYSEVARDLVGYFNLWCSAVNVASLDQLGDLVVLEQFRNIVPEHLAAFINEHKAKTRQRLPHSRTSML